MKRRKNADIVTWLKDRRQDGKETLEQGNFFDKMEGIFSRHKLTNNVQQLFQRIIQQYIDICTESLCLGPFDWSEPQREFNFVGDIEKSLDFLLSSRWFLRFTIYLNQLAEEWDKYSNGSHVFFLVPNGEKGGAHSEPYSAAKFDEVLPPDKRLIRILIGNRGVSGKTVLAVLHEIGHYIGCRQREKRKEVYKNLVAYGLCNQIYLHICQAYFRLEPELFPEAIEQDTTFASWMREFSIDLHTKLFELIGSIKGKLNEAFEKSCAEYLSNSDFSQDEELAKRETESMEAGYFEMLRPNMYKAVLQTLRYVKSDLCESYREENGTQDTIEQAFHTIEADLLHETEKDPDSERGYPHNWIDACALQLEEPAADIFMLHTTNFSLMKYANLLLDHAWDVWKLKKPGMDFPRYIASHILCSRIISVCYAMRCMEIRNGPEGNMGTMPKREVNKSIRETLLHLWGWTWRVFFQHVSSRKARAKRQALFMIENMYKEIKRWRELPGKNDDFQNIRNPLPVILDYASAIYQDERYDFYEKNSQVILRRLRALKANNSLLRALALAKCAIWEKYSLLAGNDAQAKNSVPK